MIVYNTITDQTAIGMVRDALNDLMIKFPLAGLSYFGEAVEVREAPKEMGLETLATNGRAVWYSPAWIRKTTKRERIFDLLHEWLHIFYNHPARRSDRDKSVWNTACDIVVVGETSRLLSRPGDEWPPPLDGVIPPAWAANLTAEEIYDRLMANPRLRPASGKGGGEHRSSTDFLYELVPPSFTLADDGFRQIFAENLAQAALMQQHVQGKSLEDILGARMAQRVADIKQSHIPWGRLLRGDLIGTFGDRYQTYAPPNKRYYGPNPEVVMPSFRSYTEKTLFIAVDVSASVGQSLFSEFRANIRPAAKRAKKTIITTFDAVVREEIHTTKPDHVLKDLKFSTGPHSYTDTRGAFEIAKRVKPTALVVFTDGFVLIPEEPFKKTLWVMPSGAPRQPWGKHYFMETAW